MRFTFAPLTFSNVFSETNLLKFKVLDALQQIRLWDTIECFVLLIHSQKR